MQTNCITKKQKKWKITILLTHKKFTNRCLQQNIFITQSY